jgi:hypothetical protein
MVGCNLEKVSTVEQLDDFDEEYVYDIGIDKTHPYFFANDILVHNSIYFSAYPVMKDIPEFSDFSWEKQDISNLYDNIADMTNESFPAFMKEAFNVPEKCGEVIKAGRELCATRGLFITKKRYAVMIYDNEGERMDVDGKPGKIKAMGLDLKRSDTPKPVQEFLLKVLTDVLNDVPKEEIFADVKKFREDFNGWSSWAKGSPKRVNNLTVYGSLKKGMETADVFGRHSNKKKTIPGHVLASINWNHLREIHQDRDSMKIQDGFKVIVCKLKPNPMGITSVAYPVDQLIIPDWFKALPFDDELMAYTLVDKKLDNLLGVLNWDLDQTKNNEAFDSMFSF